jgi:predicted MFS family arabinose efflux permease
VALTIGIPAGTFLGVALGWRFAFLGMSLISVLLIGWVLRKVPDFPGEEDGRRPSLRAVFVMPGVRPALFVTLLFVLAHNVLYTYIAPLLEALGTQGQTDRVLLTFGIVALASIAIVGATIDRWLRPLTLASLALFLSASLLLTIGTGSPLLVYVSAAIWGLAFGGAATLFQTANTRAAGAAADVATAMMVTTWNLAIAGGAIGGGLVLEYLGARMLPWSLLVLLIPALGAVVLGRTFGAHGPASHPGTR